MYDFLTPNFLHTFCLLLVSQMTSPCRPMIYIHHEHCCEVFPYPRCCNFFVRFHPRICRIATDNIAGPTITHSPPLLDVRTYGTYNFSNELTQLLPQTFTQVPVLKGIYVFIWYVISSMPMIAVASPSVPGSIIDSHHRSRFKIILSSTTSTQNTK